MKRTYLSVYIEDYNFFLDSVLHNYIKIFIIVIIGCPILKLHDTL